MAERLTLDALRLVERVFLPANPRKLRSAVPEVKAAAEAFKAAVRSLPDAGTILVLDDDQAADLRVAIVDALDALPESHLSRAALRHLLRGLGVSCG